VLNKNSVVVGYRMLTGLGLAVLGIVLARRGQRMLPLFIGFVGVADLYGELRINVDLLEPLHWEDQAAVDVWWVALFVGATVWWAARRRLTALRTERLFYLLVLTALISQANFIGNPFGPILGFAGTGFIVFGLLWGFLTAGGWANEDSPALPRSSRGNCDNRGTRGDSRIRAPCRRAAPPARN